HKHLYHWRDWIFGKVLIEKLLRSCPNLNKLYILIRHKKDKNVTNRVQEFCQNMVFDCLRKENPNFIDKVHVIPGDCSLPELGLSPHDRTEIVENVNIIFHLASNVHNCVYPTIGEEFYDSPIHGSTCMKMAECLDEKLLEDITPIKAITEELVKNEGKDIPIGLFRPSCGWIDNYNGPTALMLYILKGILRVMHIDEQAIADLVPCDMTVNALIACAWDVHERKGSGDKDIPIYNYVSSPENPITWKEYVSTNIKLSSKTPLNNCYWKAFMLPVKNYSVFKMYSFFLHKIPAAILDIIIFTLGMKPKMKKLYNKIDTLIDVISYFSTSQWKFSNQNIQELRQKLSQEDQRIFKFNVKLIYWTEYLNECVRGNKLYLLKEDSKTLPDARSQQRSKTIGQMTPIQTFYEGTNVLITGGTGFMGKVLIEKLLRSCPKLSKIYLLIRSKEDKNINDRIFDCLRNEEPNFMDKIRVISGDCSQSGFGMSPNDKAEIVENVNIIFHLAANVLFKTTLKDAMYTNYLGTQNLLLLCKDCLNIKAVIYISTAYSNCVQSLIGEEFYTLPINGNTCMKLVDGLDEKLLTDITPILLGNWPNAYTYTKAIAEELVENQGKDIPIGIFRPSIILNTKEEPLPGWIENYNGPTAPMLSILKGFVRTMMYDKEAVTDFVPCDMAVNALITCAWDVHGRKRCGDKNIPIYNYVSSTENPITWKEYVSTNIKLSWKTPLNNCYWKAFILPVKNEYIFKTYSFFLHKIPASILDTILLTLGKEPKMQKLYRKLQTMIDTLTYFGTHQWQFSNQNVQELWQKLCPDDQTLFKFSMKHVNWSEYLEESLKGIKIYLLKEDFKSLPEARRQQRK
ncbi:hypothetical protein C0J52_04435, partial [Blattella germanica]